MGERMKSNSSVGTPSCCKCIYAAFRWTLRARREVATAQLVLSCAVESAFLLRTDSATSLVHQVLHRLSDSETLASLVPVRNFPALHHPRVFGLSSTTLVAGAGLTRLTKVPCDEHGNCLPSGSCDSQGHRSRARTAGSSRVQQEALG